MLISVKYLLVCFLKVKLPFELGATKLKYVINFGIAPYFRDILYNHLQKSDCFVISFDESLNDYTQNCQMDILIRYFWSCRE